MLTFYIDSHYRNVHRRFQHTLRQSENDTMCVCVLTGVKALGYLEGINDCRLHLCKEANWSFLVVNEALERC